MPLYEYECKDCGNRVEVLQGIDEQGPKCCKKCGGELKRLMGAPGLIFKGSGFYVNDYARKDTVADKPKGSKERTESAGEEEASETARDTTDEPRKPAQKRTQPQQERERRR